MMQRLIKSIRKNPNAGRTEFYVPGMPTKTVTTVNGKITNIVEERPIQIMQSMHPDPDYIITFQPLTIQCRFCESKFDSDLLEVVDCCDLNDRIYDVCPKCGKIDCIAEPIVDETVGEFKRRQEEQC